MIEAPAPKRSQKAKKSKRLDKRPARLRYWLKRTLESRKIAHLMKYCGMTKQSAYNRWHTERKGRVKDGYLRTA